MCVCEGERKRDREEKKRNNTAKGLRIFVAQPFFGNPLEISYIRVATRPKLAHLSCHRQQNKRVVYRRTSDFSHHILLSSEREKKTRERSHVEMQQYPYACRHSSLSLPFETTSTFFPPKPEEPSKENYNVLVQNALTDCS